MVYQVFAGKSFSLSLFFLIFAVALIVMSTPRPSNAPRGIGFKILSVTSFAIMAALLKAASKTVPAGELVFFRSTFALIPLLIWLTIQRKLRTGLKVKRPIGHVWRGLAGSSAMLCNFAALSVLPLPEATAIGYASPILIVVFAAMFLGETIGLWRIGAVALGMIGVIVVLSPNFNGGGGQSQEAFGAVVALMGATFGALSSVFIRKLTLDETTSSIVFWFSITCALSSLITIPFGWVLPSPIIAILLILAGICGGLGQIFLTSAYHEADASIVAPFEYFSMLLALTFGYFIFNEVPTLIMLSGATLIICAGILVILRERYLGISRNKSREARSPRGT